MSLNFYRGGLLNILSSFTKQEREAFEGYCLFFWKKWITEDLFIPAMERLGLSKDDAYRVRFWIIQERGRHAGRGHGKGRKWKHSKLRHLGSRGN